MKFQIEEVPNEEILRFHLDQKVSKELMIYIDSVEAVKEERGSKKLCSLTESLLAIPGVEELIFDKHEVSVHKGRCFLWEDLVPEIIYAIKCIFSPNEEITELPRKVCTAEDRARNQRVIDRFHEGGIGRYDGELNDF